MHKMDLKNRSMDEFLAGKLKTKSHEKGFFVTLYGINNLGKSTQAEKLVSWFNENGVEAEYLKYPIYALEPSGPIVWNQIKSGKGQTMSEGELQTWYAFNRRHYEPILKKKLESGITIISEDYSGTGMAWGMAKGLTRNFVDIINMYLLKEDLAILFQGERFKESIEENHVHETNSHLIDVVCKKVHSDLGKELGWKPINANQSKDKVFNDLLAIVRRELKR